MYLGNTKIKGAHLGSTIIKAVYLGAKKVWSFAVPFVLSFTSYPLTKTHGAGTIQQCETTSSHYYIATKKNSDAIEFGKVQAKTGDIPVQGCNKVRVEYTTSDYVYATINGNVVNAGVTSGTLVFDVSGESFSFSLQVVESTEYFTGELEITKVEFYYED